LGEFWMITKLNPWERKVNNVVMAISFGFLHDIKHYYMN